MTATPRRRVLVLAYYFPPLGGGGVQHSLKLVRYLAESGYEPFVVTGPALRRHRWAPLDSSLEAELPADLRIERIARGEPPQPGQWRDRGERWLNLPSIWGKWWVEGSVEAARRLPQFDIVYATMSPYESAAAGARIAVERGVPWVAGLRDPWALDEMIVYPSGLHRRVEERTMRAALRSADAVVMNTPEAAARVTRAFAELASRNIVAITNGFDPADFAAAPKPRDDRAFRIVHTGNLHTDTGEHQRRTGRLRRLVGGAVEGVDILTRSHVYLLRAVDLLLRRRPDLRDVVEVYLAGVVTGQDERVVQVHGRHARVLGYLPHDESVDLIRTADLLFLPMHDLPPGVRATIVPGKTYEYLASGTPILGAVPAGDARDFLLASGRAVVCDPDDVEGMSRAIEAEISRPSGRPPFSVEGDKFLAAFERDRLAGRLAEVFDGVLGTQQ